MNKSGITVVIMLLLFNTALFGQKYGHGQDSVNCIENLSLYRINYKIWKDHDFDEKVIKQVPILSPWRWVFFNCPESSQNIYIDGVTILKYMIDKAPDDSIRRKYIDTLMMVYDQRIKYFGSSPTSREGLVLGRKGVDLYSLLPDKYYEVYQILKRSVDLEGNESTGAVLVYYFITTIASAVNGDIDSTAIVETYDKVISIADENIKADKSDPEELADWQNVKNNIESNFEPFATCDDIVRIFEKKFVATPHDTDLLKQITTMLDRKNCTNTDLFFQAAKNLYDLAPTPESGYLMGIMNMRKENYEEAAKYFFEALNNLQDSSLISNADLMLANIYMNLNDYPKARAYAYKGLAINPGNGSFYILIGDLYARSANQCGDNDLTKKVAYWASVDMYQKAKSVDSSVTDMANERIATYSGYFPSVETIFFYDLKEGQPYTIGCWINETTTVRAAK